MEFLEKRLTVVCGHYGVGKTNLSINLAIDCAREGEDVTLIDMDIVNPYFRSSEYSDVLSENDVRLIGPNFANTNLDTPSLPAAIGDIMESGQRVIVDVGGDDAGATALGVYSDRLHDADVMYVVNRYRSQTTTAQEAVDILREIEAVARIKADCIVNNSHLKQSTTAETIEGSIPFAEEVSKLTGLPIRFTTAPVGVDAYNNKFKIYPVGVYVRAPWEKQVIKCRK